MGLVSGVLVLAAAATVFVTVTSRDRTVLAFALLAALDLLASLFVHWTVKGVGRSEPLMLVDCVALYIMCLTAVCRLDRPLWLYGLAAVTATECLAHLAYVAGVLSGHGHILCLNLLFLAQLGCLIQGRWSAPEEEATEKLGGGPPFPSLTRRPSGALG